MLTKLRIKLRQLYFKDTQFANLMTKRIFNVLLVANPYDAFMLEDDGRIDEKIFNEYMNLSLRYPPRFTQVSTAEETWEQLRNTMFDLVICMPGSDNSDTFDIAREIKKQYPHLPLVVLTPFSHGIKERMEHEDLSIFEYVFCWLGNTDLLVSIIKLIEDKMNLEHDIKEVGVQMIMLVEDSIRFYSSVLPNLYKFVLRQSQEFATEALNEHQRTLRMRGRPKSCWHVPTKKPLNYIISTRTTCSVSYPMPVSLTTESTTPRPVSPCCAKSVSGTPLYPLSFSRQKKATVAMRPNWVPCSSIRTPRK